MINVNEANLSFEMIGIFVVGPEHAVVAVGNLVLGDPVVFFSIVAAFGHQASYECRMTNVQLDPFVIL